MTRKIFFALIALLATLVGLYPAIYFFVDRKFGLLQSKANSLLTSTTWNVGFYIHIVLGGIALLVGWTQFITRIRIKNIHLHRQIGKLYVVTAIISSLAAIYIAVYATGEWITSLGFMCLGIIWFYTTLKAYTDIKKNKQEDHRKMMTFSYAMCLSAVTLRIYLPILIALFGNFNDAYILVAWLCWFPNFFVAWLLTRNLPVSSIGLTQN